MVSLNDREAERLQPPGYFGLDQSSLSGGSIRIPQIGTAQGAAFGEYISDDDRLFAANREPVAHFTVYFVARDVFDNWFEIHDPVTKKINKDVDIKLQKALTDLNAKQVFTTALEYERIYGWSLIVGAFDDAQTQADLQKPRTEGSKLVQIVAYPKTMITGTKDEKRENELRFGKPIIYRINRGKYAKRMRVHHSRVIRVESRTGGKSALDPIFDDMTTYRNQRWSLGQFLWRYGSGFPELKLHGYSAERLIAFGEAGVFEDLMSRTYVLTNDAMEFEFKGAKGIATNPAPYIKPIVESMSAGSRIPEPVFRGAQAGQLGGSQVNEREYFKLIGTEQSNVEPNVRQLNQWIIEGENITVDNYDLYWLGGFELTELQKANLEYMREQTNVLRLQYMLPDEVRELNDITDPLPEGQGQILKGTSKEAPPKPLGMETEFGQLLQVVSPGGEKWLVKRVDPNDV